MVLVIGALIFGFIAAQLGTFTPKQRSIMDKISTVSLMLLLFSMGLSLGSNPELLAALPSLGLKSFLLAVGIVVGSVGLTWFGVSRRGAARD